ncbi:digestive cysteine proteinase 1-like isoform X2 [Plodia interpunctella]|uniref:digestive cysteine proteinase 1-like isoform X2 n=1 Tax=Plodia interpunctella TaxID=58824 RepID=UPI002367579A|nr:digestive cysteine proteinase 1-like isoform X2 [Plodia interpunctella]
MKCFREIFYVLSALTIASGLSWSRTYSLRAVLNIPSAEIQEPYQIWTDGDTGISRIDFYDGLDKLYKLRTSADSFLYYKIHPESFESGHSCDVCDVYNSSDYNIKMFAKRHYLPGPEDEFKLKGRYPIGNVVTEKWGYEVGHSSEGLDLKYTYTVWVKSESTGSIPIKYEHRMKVDGTEMFYFYHDYLYFNTSKPNPEIFEIPSSLDCKIGSAQLHEPLDPVMEYVNPALEDKRINRAFDSFIVEHDKNYKDDKEYRERQNFFKNNLRLINSVNRQHKSYSLALNQFADLSDTELSILNALHVHPTNISEYIYHDDDTIGDDINSFDWRVYNAISPIKDQTVLCGSCYAFTSAAAIESTRFIYTGCQGVLEEISEQAIIDCSWSAGKKVNFGCDSGNLYYTLTYIKNFGVPTKDSYGPYLAMEGICNIKNAEKIRKISNFVKIPKDKTKIQNALRKNGPLAIALNGNPKTFIFYSKGIYDNEKCANQNTDLSHGVTLIGFGEESGEEYWILKNSYGTKWGENGFMRIATKSNICGVMNTAYGVQFKRKNKIKKCFKKNN